MTAIRVGQGVDVHAFADDGRPLRLGGVEVPGAPGLVGHSDGDAVCHAVVDALLGAAGLGDIGGLVGVDRPDTAGADSTAFVAMAVAAVQAAGWRVGNVDVAVVAARPRLAPHRDAVRASLARLLGVPVDRVSVKATTTDGLGLTGRGEGLACLVVALLEAAG